MKNTPLSQHLFEKAKTLIPGGVNSPVRAFKSVGGIPRFIARAKGAHLWDVDGNQLIDYIGSWGPMILGHSHPQVQEAICNAAQTGTSYGAPTESEIQLAELVLRAYPKCERIRFVSSGTEATMSALRLARGFTGRDYIVKFRGNYHGHADGLLVEAGSGLLTGGDRSAKSAPSSAGIPQAFAELTLVADYNNPEALEELFKDYGHQIAAVIFEPVVGNSGVIIPTPSFLQTLHQVTKHYGALLIADEVMTGFRLALGGATELLKLEPDLLCWGKIIGGGLPVGAYGGRSDIMEYVAPQGPVYQAGTLSGNPIAMAAGIATLRLLHETPPYTQLEHYGQQLQSGLESIARDIGTPIVINRMGSMLTVFFKIGSVLTYADAMKSNTEAFKHFFHGLLDKDIYWPPSQYEAAFFSVTHTSLDLERTLEASRVAFTSINHHST